MTTEQGHTKAQYVSDDVWGIVFTFLDIKDHIKLGNACKWLQRVSCRPWTFPNKIKLKRLERLDELKYLIKHKARVKHLNLSYSKITNEELVHFDRLTSLQTLNLYCCKIIASVINSKT